MNSTGKRSVWAFGTREVVYAAIGAALYGLLSWATNIFPLPAAGNVTFRPAVAVLMLFSVVYGPWVGLIAGIVGNTVGDALTGWGLYWNWSVGNGLMGLIPGLVAGMLLSYNKGRDLGLGIGAGLIGAAVGMLFASLTEIVVSGIDMGTALGGYFTPAFLGNAVVIIILLCAVSLLICHWTVKGKVEGLGVLFCIMGLFLAYIGNLFHSIKPNYFAGLRLPWTLESEDNWRMTHQFASKIWFAGGLLLAILALILPVKPLIFTFMGIMLVLVLVPAWYSYDLYRKNNSSQTPSA